MAVKKAPKDCGCGDLPPMNRCSYVIHDSKGGDRRCVRLSCHAGSCEFEPDLSVKRCNYCGTDLDLANELSLGFGHSTRSCREHLKAALMASEKECARLRALVPTCERGPKGDAEIAALAQRVGRLESALDEIAMNCEGVVAGKLPHFSRRDIADAAATRARAALDATKEGT